MPRFAVSLQFADNRYEQICLLGLINEPARHVKLYTEGELRRKMDAAETIRRRV